MLASTRNADWRPFRLTPDAEFVYISRAQLDAYSRLFSAIHDQQQYLLLTGVPGTGKTLFLRRLLLDLENAGIVVCAFWNPVSSPNQLWEACCERVGLNVDPSQNMDVQSALLGRLQEDSASMVLLLDEADAIRNPVLESIARLIAGCPGKKAAVSILFCGQPALETRLRVLGMAATIATNIRLEPLHRREVKHFIRHHLRAQAGRIEYQFSPEAVERIIAHCGGLPAQINILCSGALFLAELEEQTMVTSEMIDKLVADRCMGSGGPLTNVVFTPAAEAVMARVKGLKIFDNPSDLPTPDPEAHTARPLDYSRADRNTVHATHPSDRVDTSFAENSRFQALDPATDVDLPTIDVTEGAAPPGSPGDGSSDPSSDGFAGYEESDDSTTTDHDAGEPAPTALPRGPGPGDLQTLDLSRFPLDRIGEEAIIRAPHQRLHALDPHAVQTPIVEYRPAPQARSSRQRLRLRLLSTPLPWLAMLLLAVTSGGVYISNGRIAQASTWIEAAGSDIASWLDRFRRSWTPSRATIASKLPEESTRPSTDDDNVALSQTREVDSSAELTIHAEPSTPATSIVEVEASDRSSREHPPVLAQPAETSLPHRPAPEEVVSLKTSLELAGLKASPELAGLKTSPELAGLKASPELAGLKTSAELAGLKTSPEGGQGRPQACPRSYDAAIWTNCVGEVTFPDGFKYVGEFRDGQYHGQGTATSPDGEKYVGALKDGKRDGRGSGIYPDGRRYVGDWRDDKANGQGTAMLPDGKKYVGEFRDGQYHGQGTMSYSDGRKYIGEWRDNRRNGQGIEYRHDGSILRSGIWENENFVRRK